MVKSLAKSVAINVGVNTKREWGGFRGPIFPNGSFEFIHIPWKEKYGRIEPPPKKCEQYKTYNSYIKQRLKNRYTYILESPDFYHCTYASTVIEGTAAHANKRVSALLIPNVWAPGVALAGHIISRAAVLLRFKAGF